MNDELVKAALGRPGAKASAMWPGPVTHGVGLRKLAAVLAKRDEDDAEKETKRHKREDALLAKQQAFMELIGLLNDDRSKTIGGLKASDVKLLCFGFKLDTNSKSKKGDGPKALQDHLEKEWQEKKEDALLKPRTERLVLTLANGSQGAQVQAVDNFSSDR
jgi:hypothetical protein